MYKLPPIDTKNQKNRKKKEVEVEKLSSQKWSLPNIIESRIFKDGKTWFELDHITGSCQDKRKHILNSDCKTYLGMKNMYAPQPPLPDLNELNDVRIRSSLYRKRDDTVRSEGSLMAMKTVEMNLHKQWEDIEEEESTLQNLVKSYDTFIRLNEEKRMTSRKKYDFFKNENREWIGKIDEITKQKEYLKGIKDQMNEKCDKYFFYQKFCSAAATLQGYTNSMHFVTRYLTLKEAQEKVTVNNTTKTVQLMNRVSQLNKNAQEKLDLIQSLSTKCSEQKEQFRFAQSEVTNKQALLRSVQKETTVRLRKLIQAFFAVLNIYGSMKHRHSSFKLIPLKHFEKQLVYIHRNMEAIERLCRNNFLKEQEALPAEKLPEVVYPLDIQDDSDMNQTVCSSKIRVSDILKSVETIRKQQKEEEELEVATRRAQFAQHLTDVQAIEDTEEQLLSSVEEEIEKKEMVSAAVAKLLWSRPYLPLSTHLNQSKHAVIRRPPYNIHKAKETLSKPTKTRERQFSVACRKQRSKSINSLKRNSLCSITEFPLARKFSIRRSLSKARDLFRNGRYRGFSINDDDTITIFSQ